MRNIFKDRILNPVKLSRLHGMDTKERSLSGSQKRLPPAEVDFQNGDGGAPPGVPPPPANIIYIPSHGPSLPYSLLFHFPLF